MQFAKTLLQRFGLFSSAEAETVDPVYARRLDRLCASDNKRGARTAATASPSWASAARVAASSCSPAGVSTRAR